MDIQNYYAFQGGELLAKIRSVPRDVLEEQVRQFGAQYALLCQRLEALYTPDRLSTFVAIRPGGLDEIDRAIALCNPDNHREKNLLQSFRELNRVLLPFMDVYEDRQISDFAHLGQSELEELLAGVKARLEKAKTDLSKEDFRQAQNAGGTMRLASIMQQAIERELRDRFGVEPT